MELNNHDPLDQTVPDAMHTIKDAIVNVYNIITGKDDTLKCRAQEHSFGRFGITLQSLQKRKICRNNPEVPYSLSSDEIKLADCKALTILTPVHVDFVPDTIFTRTANLKSHDWKQVLLQIIATSCK